MGYPQRIFHALLAWPEVHNTALWRRLRALQPLISVSYAKATMLPAHLGATDYYHILHISPLHWRAFSKLEQQRIAAHIPLIVLGPEAALATDMEQSRAGLYFPETHPLDVSLSTVCEFHAQLAESKNLSQALAVTCGRLALVGNANCLDMEDIPPMAREVNAPPQPAVVNQVHPGGVGIGYIEVRGDSIMGTKIVQHAEGDQVNINRLGSAHNEASHRKPDRPTRVPSIQRQMCPVCHQVFENLTYQFCSNCGHRLGDTL